MSSHLIRLISIGEFLIGIKIRRRSVTIREILQSQNNSFVGFHIYIIFRNINQENVENKQIARKNTENWWENLGGGFFSKTF